MKGQSEVQNSSTSSPGFDNATGTKRVLPEPMRRESREWKPSAQFFKPLLAGWKREVIYGRDPETQELTAKPEQIFLLLNLFLRLCQMRFFSPLKKTGTRITTDGSARKREISKVFTRSPM